MRSKASGVGAVTVRQPRLRDGVVRRLTDAIVAGEFRSGETLPTEPFLISEFGVSRTVVREALKTLEAKGLVEVRHGRGTVVLERERWDLLDADVLAAEMEMDQHGRLFGELSRVRVALESEMAAQAALEATDEQLREMDALLREMRDLLDDPDGYLRGDVAFHDAIIRAAGNRIARAVMRSMLGPLEQSRRLTNSLPGGVQKAQEFHEAILLQLQRRNPEGAGEAMRRHLLWSWDEWMRASNGSDAKRALSPETPRHGGQAAQ